MDWFQCDRELCYERVKANNRDTKVASLNKDTSWSNKSNCSKFTIKAFYQHPNTCSMTANNELKVDERL